MEINGIEYRIGKLDPIKQLHVARRLAPLLAEAVKAASVAEDESMLAGPIAAAFAEMSDEDVEYVTTKCLGVVHRVQGENAFKVMNSSGGFQYPDMGLTTILQLVVEVVKENLGDFFSTGQSILSGAK
ncbi:hypothetical protein DYQ86_16030 [Acidobacteria bacterium AB60]|nr:hypothetical protein DYQ86_16030 [Acidobacteria bacterium AB60]